MEKENLRSKWLLLLLVLSLFTSACKKSNSDLKQPKEADKNSFVPRLNTKYTYKHYRR
ncbi:hypothetical protein [Pedobacter sp. UBA4863]|uniref:hypothetical protein n=1 Tax=Pedobacter sp. UBA4863 TaxID=1947060 RepID=UPI0025FCD41B|nr:hypothetical protein [Pedobacter sp. UBA4863]